MSNERFEIEQKKWKTAMHTLKDEEEQTTLQQALLIEATRIGEPITFTPREPEPDKLTMALLNKIPLLSGFLRSIDSTGASFSKLAALNGSSSALSTAHGFQIGSLVLSAIDIIRIPIMFLAAKLLGVELPFSLTHAGKLTFSFVVIGLAIAGLLAPVTAGASIGVAAAVVGFVASAVMVFNLFSELKETSQGLKQVAEDLNEAEKDLALTQNQAIELVKRLNSLANSDGKDEAKDIERNDIKAELKTLELSYELQKEKVQGLHDKQLLLQRVWDNDLGLGAGLDKAVGIGLAAGALAGAIVVFVFPPLGAAIAGGCAAAGGLYLAARLAVAGIQMLVEKFSKKSDSPREAMDSPEDTVHDPLVDNSPDLSNIKPHESTCDAMKGLFNKNAAQVLHQQMNDHVRLGKLDKRLEGYISKENQAGVLQFFTEMAQDAKEHGSTEADVRAHINYFVETNPQAMSMLKTALAAQTIPTEAKQGLLNYEPMVAILKEKAVIKEPISRSRIDNELTVTQPKSEDKDNNPFTIH